MLEFENKTALVTGASRGTGRATALTLARAGANVLVHYGHSAHEADSLVESLIINNMAERGIRRIAVLDDYGIEVHLYN